MLHVLVSSKRTALFLSLAAALVLTFMLAGCSSNSDSAETGVVPPTATLPSGQQPHKAAAGVAVSDKLTIDQLRLDSPIKQTTHEHGLKYLEFKYTENDGKVYLCTLPLPESTGQHTISEWLATFSVYKQPKVLAQKKKKNTGAVGDFPFIAPRPQQQSGQTESAPSGGQMPQLPQMPSSPAPK